jgi:hypothetical protein
MSVQLKKNLVFLFATSLFFLVTSVISFQSVSTLYNTKSELCKECMNSKCGGTSAESLSGGYKAGVGAVVAASLLMFLTGGWLYLMR